MFDIIFGGMFDLNGDIHTDSAEEFVGFAVMEDMLNEEDGEDDFDASKENEWE